jgi:hypothetical protein
MTDYEIHTFTKAHDYTLWSLAEKKFGPGHGAKWKEFLLETKPNSDVWAPAHEPYGDNIRVKIPLTTPPIDSSEFDGKVTVTASWGVNIRAHHKVPDTVLVTDKQSKGKFYKYKKSSLTEKDDTGRIWVEVLIDETKHTTGWLPISGPSILSDPQSATEIWAKLE